MCIALKTRLKTSALFIPLPTSFTESFDEAQASTRGNLTWKTLFSTDQLSAGICSLPASHKGSLGLHKHKQPELYHVLTGSAIVEVEGKQHQLEKGMTIFIPGDAEHGVVRDESTDDEVFSWLYVFPSRWEDVEYRFRSEGAYGTQVGKRTSPPSKAKL